MLKVVYLITNYVSLWTAWLQDTIKVGKELSQKLQAQTSLMIIQAKS